MNNLPFATAAGPSCSLHASDPTAGSGPCIGTVTVAKLPMPGPDGPGNYTGGQVIWPSLLPPPVCFPTP